MCQAIVKNDKTSGIVISLNQALQEEPLALYVGQEGALSLRLCNGRVIALGQDVGSQHLLQQDEVTIESFVGGFLAAGYRVAVRAAA